MKNKELCKKCKYRGTIGSRTGAREDITCDYFTTSDERRTCLVKGGVDVKDRRGDDFNNCLLYEEGEQIGRAMNTEPIIERRMHRRVGGKRRDGQ